MKALVFGATGLIGTALVKRLLLERFEVVGVSRKKPRNKLSPKYKHIQVDIANNKDFNKIPGKYDLVFNMAAHISPGYLTEEALPCLLVNSLGTLNVLEFMVKRGIKRLIHSSSVTVYGRPQRLIANETSPLRPITVYGISKLTAESYCNMYSKLHSLDITTLRYASVYGPGLNLKTALPIFIDKALKNENIYIYGNGMRNQDYVYVDDVIQANMLSASKGINGVFNIGSGIQTTMNELAETIIDVLESKSRILFDRTKKQEFSFGIDIEKAEKILGYNPYFNLRKGLEEFKKTL